MSRENRFVCAFEWKRTVTASAVASDRDIDPPWVVYSSVATLLVGVMNLSCHLKLHRSRILNIHDKM